LKVLAAVGVRMPSLRRDSMPDSSESLSGVGCLGEHCGYDLLVFFRLEGTGGIDDMAAGADGADAARRMAR
jgi:hypothetical protein